MKITKFPQISFKGYDAAPLKGLYMHRTAEDGIIAQMEYITKEEGIKLTSYTDAYHTDRFSNVRIKNKQWAQDDKFISEGKDSKPLLLREKAEYYKGFAEKLKRTENISSITPDIFLAGGNMFAGKKENGEKWLLVGEDEISQSGFPRKIALEKISKTYNVKPENITILSQPNFHLDMAIRPIGYPYVLVNDHKLVRENIKKHRDKIPDKAFEEEIYYCTNPCKNFYVSADATVEELEKAGFVPIRIAGVYSFDKLAINYMNSIVNKHDDGSISYITNSAKDSHCAVFDKIFENDLKGAVKNLDKVHFVSGDPTPNLYNNRNPIMYLLKYMQGGIHCMTLEEPDFKKWGENENK